MTIAVTIRGAFKSGLTVVVPLETTWVEPSINAIRASCDKELRVLYPLDLVASSYEIVELERVISKICAYR